MSFKGDGFIHLIVVLNNDVGYVSLHINLI